MQWKNPFLSIPYAIAHWCILEQIQIFQSVVESPWLSKIIEVVHLSAEFVRMMSRWISCDPRQSAPKPTWTRLGTVKLFHMYKKILVSVAFHLSLSKPISLFICCKNVLRCVHYSRLYINDSSVCQNNFNVKICNCIK